MYVTRRSAMKAHGVRFDLNADGDVIADTRRGSSMYVDFDMALLIVTKLSKIVGEEFLELVINTHAERLGATVEEV